VLEAVARADAIVIGPSNPIISIGPVLAVPGLREALDRSRAPIVAVSPYVAGRVVKGPTDAFMSAAGLARGTAGVAAAYGDLLDGIVADEQVTELPALETGTLMQSPGDARRLAEETLAFAVTLRSRGF
jgi:LPPG:FO 2-phospho-L-lactate transferase